MRKINAWLFVTLDGVGDILRVLLAIEFSRVNADHHELVRIGLLELFQLRLAALEQRSFEDGEYKVRPLERVQADVYGAARYG